MAATLQNVEKKEICVVTSVLSARDGNYVYTYVKVPEDVAKDIAKDPDHIKKQIDWANSALNQSYDLMENSTPTEAPFAKQQEQYAFVIKRDYEKIQTRVGHSSTEVKVGEFIEEPKQESVNTNPYIF
jgi:hypothetical protein